VFRTFTCITHQHSPWLLGVAVLVCLIAAATTMRLYTHGRSLAGPRAFMWLIAGGVSGGAGIWATHFISMLAYQPGLPTGYDAAGTLLSLAIAAAGVALGLTIAARLRSTIGAAVGGAVVGLTIAAMHYAGMAAFRTEGIVIWDPTYVVAAVGAGVIFASLALVAVSARPNFVGSLSGAVLLVLGIVAVHFVSMAAVTIMPDSSLRPPASLLPNQSMALVVGALTGLIMVGAAATMLLEAWNQRRALAQLNLIIEAMPDGLAYFDADDRFILWNGKYEAMVGEFGLRPERGRSYVECILGPAVAATEADAGAGSAFIAERLARRAQTSSSREEQSPSGRWVRVEENATAEGGRVAVVHDINTLMETARELAASRDEAEAANRAKSEFLTNMSHEIRTPLNGVLGVADALALGPLDSEQSELVEIIRASGAVLNRLLCDILDLARVESGALELAAQPFDLADAVRDVAHLSAAHARDKGIDFRLALAADVDRVVLGDPVRLKQILTNLASNAIKFTDKGFVEIEVSRQEDTSDGLRFVVRDTGCGFDSGAQERLFGRFQQGYGAMNRRAGGSGLGLAIARQLTELMGGKLEARSVEGRGSTFTLSLSLPIVAPSEAVETPPLQADGEGRPTHILIVDDNANNRRLLEVLLTHFGAVTEAAANGEQAVEAWRAGEFDAIIMDMQMPVMDGLAATRSIREAERAEKRARTPIIFVSANAMPEHLEAARAAGGDGHVSKPIAADKLFAALSGSADETAAAA
jgi:signal transduction histidine kinase/ActR/RegA family two-component response regulator